MLFEYVQSSNIYAPKFMGLCHKGYFAKSDYCFFYQRNQIILQYVALKVLFYILWNLFKYLCSESISGIMHSCLGCLPSCIYLMHFRAQNTKWTYISAALCVYASLWSLCHCTFIPLHIPLRCYPMFVRMIWSR